MNIFSLIHNLLDKLEKQFNCFSKKPELIKPEPMKLDNKEILKRKWINNTREIINRIEKDIKIYPFKDKFSKNDNKLQYRFENGDLVKFIILDNNIFEVKFKIHNEDTHYKIKSTKLYNKLFYISGLMDDCVDRIQTSEPKKIEHPLKDKYNLLVRKIKLRVEEINKLPINDTKRKALINELDNYKKIASKLKNEIMGQKV